MGSLEANAGTKIRVQEVYRGNIIKERRRRQDWAGEEVGERKLWSRLHKAGAHVAVAPRSVLSTKVPGQVKRSSLSALTSFGTRIWAASWCDQE